MKTVQESVAMVEGRQGRAALRRVFLAGLLVLTLALSVRDFFSYQFGFTPDSVEYTMLAQSLVDGQPFGLHFARTGYQDTHFPFGFPVVLIPLVLVTPRGFETAALLSLAATLSSVAILFLAWRWFVPALDARWRYPVTAMFALAPTTLMHTRLVLSEALFGVLFLVTLYFAARVLQHPERRSWWIRLGVAAFFMVFTRSIGLVALAALGVYMLVALRGKSVRGFVWMGATMAALIGVVLVVTPVTPANMLPAEYLRWYVVLGPVRGAVNPIDIEPLDDLPPGPTPVVVPTAAAVAPTIAAVVADKTTTDAGDVSRTPEIVRANPYTVNGDYLAQHLFVDIRRLVTLTGGGDVETELANRVGMPWLAAVPALGVLVLLMIGTARWVQARRAVGLPRVSLFFFVGLCYALVVFFWRGGGERMWYPIQPHLFLAVLVGLYVVAQGAAGLVKRVAHRLPAPQVTVGIVGLTVALWLGLAIYRDWTLRTSVEMWGDLHTRAAAVEKYIEPAARVSSDWPEFDYLYSGRQMTQIPFATSADDLLANLKRHAVRYLVVAVDDTFTRTGMARRNNRVEDVENLLRELVARGDMTQVYADAYPLQILRVNAP